MAIGNLFKLNMRASQFSVSLENRYWYEQVSSVGDAELLIDAFVEDVLPVLLDVQDSLVLMVEGEAVNLDDSTDFHTKAVAGAGDIDGDSLPPFNQWSFKYATTNSKIRSGGKRIAGVPESFQIDGTATAVALTRLDLLATAFINLVVDSVTGATFVPLLYTPGNLATAGEPLKTSIASVSYSRISSQLSRKLF